MENALLTVVGSFVGAWLAAQFALVRFYREKLWERKIGVYSSIFEALHEIDDRFSFLKLAVARGGEVHGVLRRELESASEKAYKDLQRIVDRETWLLPVVSQNRINKFLADMHELREGDTDRYSYLDTAARNAIADLRDLAQQDLRMLSSGWPWLRGIRATVKPSGAGRGR